jgi:hypothetical protein
MRDMPQILELPCLRVVPVARHVTGDLSYDASVCVCVRLDRPPPEQQALVERSSLNGLPAHGATRLFHLATASSIVLPFIVIIPFGGPLPRSHQ